jgi:wobble nucleotide-excising tRNase
VENQKNPIKRLNDLDSEISSLEVEIKSLSQKMKISKKEKVADTIESVLKRFFGNKYTINKKNFRLSLNKNLLDKGQAKEVLSQGEKNIIAFAYFLGDVHLKVEAEDDYEKIFFILDDPISSMDYHHVYTVNQVIKDLKEITKVSGQIRFIIFTHHLDFMRVLVGNNTVKKSLVLKNSEIKEFNNNLTIPYILHLQDIYRISEEIEEPNHTTPNSIRHIIETLTKFENIVADEGAIGNYIKENFPDDSRTYTLIQDLSHGGWRTEQSPIHSNSIIDVCKAIINLVDKKYKGQVEYCRSLQ